LDKEDTLKHGYSPANVLKALTEPRLIYLCAIYFLIQICFYGVVYYLPTQVAVIAKQKVGLIVGLLTSIPWLCALAAAYFVTRYSDKTGKRSQMVSVTLFFAFVGVMAFVFSSAPVIAMAGLCIAAAALISAQPVFWTLPTGYLAGNAAAGGIAFINSLGNLGGFVAPNIKTWAEIKFDSPAAGMFALAASAIAGALLALVSKKLGLKEKAAAR
jgi:predicted MFS family arabinose efflux permease